MHFVFAVKYRKSLLLGSIKKDMINILKDVCEKYNYHIDAIQSDINHIHLLLDLPPTSSAVDVVRRLKQISTNQIYQKHREKLKKEFWKRDIFWSSGYFVCSVGDANTATIQKYINEQG